MEGRPLGRDLLEHWRRSTPNCSACGSCARTGWSSPRTNAPSRGSRSTANLQTTNFRAGRILIARSRCTWTSLFPTSRAAEETVLRRGATRLQDKGEYRSYADPAGHPFCLYRDTGGGSGADRQATGGKIERVVFHCFSPRALAASYATLLNMPVRVQDSPAHVVISRDDGGDGPMLAFQHAPSYTPPRWPDPAYPQQIHLDLDVDDAGAAQRPADALGATPLPDMGGMCPVYADPSAHPFCLCSPGQ